LYIRGKEGFTMKREVAIVFLWLLRLSGLSFSQVGKKLGCNATTVRDVSGARSNISQDLWKKLERWKAFDTSLFEPDGRFFKLSKKGQDLLKALKETKQARVYGGHKDHVLIRHVGGQDGRVHEIPADSEPDFDAVEAALRSSQPQKQKGKKVVLPTFTRQPADTQLSEADLGVDLGVFVGVSPEESRELLAILEGAEANGVPLPVITGALRRALARGRNAA
jgi:hypothetical protein